MASCLLIIVSVRIGATNLGPLLLKNGLILETFEGCIFSPMLLYVGRLDDDDDDNDAKMDDDDDDDDDDDLLAFPALLDLNI